MRYKDLNRNGTLDPYEDWRLPTAARVADLLSQMTLGEKVGAVLHGTAPIQGGPMAAGPAYDAASVDTLVRVRGVTSMITRMAMPARVFAEQANFLQQVAERGRLGIPVTVSTDPRHYFQSTDGASVASAGLAQWPGPLGFGATRDAALVRRFASIARDEYRALGIHMSLSPQADLASEPRWPRGDGTFGDDVGNVRALVAAYVEGMQGSPSGVTRHGVAAVVKHWVGYGAAVDGFDGHNSYGRYARFGGGRFADHVSAFGGAFASHVAGVMPTYSILDSLVLGGKPLERVGVGFNAYVLRTMLRGEQGFRGLVVSDWAITNDCPVPCQTGVPKQEPWNIAMPWGVDSLTQRDRFAKGINAGIDQFGGVDDPGPLMEAIAAGRTTVALLDSAVARVLTLKFQQGLFEDPFVDLARAEAVTAAASTRALSMATQARALVVLKRQTGGQMLPKPGAVLYVQGVDTSVVRARGYRVTDDPARASAALIRIRAPYETLHPTFFFGSRQHEGSLDFAANDPQLAAVKRLAAVTPTVVVIGLDRAAVLTQLVPLASVLLADFGSSDAALMDALTGRVRPSGRLPFELPRSMDAVLRQHGDAPHDSESPLFPTGYRAGAEPRRP